MDLKTRTFFRGEDYCGAAPLLGTSVLAAILPPLTASLAARWAGSTDRSIGRFRQSLLYSLPVFVPGFALASVSAGDSGLSALEMVGMAVVVLGAPVLNTLAGPYLPRHSLSKHPLSNFPELGCGVEGRPCKPERSVRFGNRLELGSH